MEPEFSFTDKGWWRMAIKGTPTEIDLLRSGRFDHRVVFKGKYEDWEPVGDDGIKSVWREYISTLADFKGDDGTPLGSRNAYRVDRKEFVEDWEEQVTKRIATISKELAALIPPTAPTIEEKYWFSHAVLIAQTGFGKTNALSCRLRDLIPLIDQGEATVIIMEPKGVLLNALLHLRAVYKLHQKGRLVIIDPETAPVGVNPFDAGDRSSQTVNATIDRLNRIFSLLTAGLSSFQTVVMQMAVRAMFESGQTPSMATLKKILRHGIEAEGLSPTVAEFFREDFKPTGGKADTRAGEVINRLNGMLASPVFEALFSGRTTVDMGSEMAAGRLIVINANPVAVGGNATLYGRFWLEEVAKTIYPRFARLRAGLPITPVYFIIDEAGSYLAQAAELIEVLARAREAQIGMLFAMQDLNVDITDARIRNAILTNTALKFVAKTTGEIHDLCRNLGAVDPDFIYRLRQYEFAHFGPNLETAIKVRFPKMDFTKMPQMSPEQYAQMRRENTERYGYRPTTPEPPPTDPFAAARQESEKPKPKAAKWKKF